MTQAAPAYETLLLAYKPRPIRSELDYRHFLRALDALMKPHPARAESELIEVLAVLIEQYETMEHPTPNVPAGKALEHLMESRGVSRAELARATRIPRSTVTNVLRGRRELSKANIQVLADYFGVSPMAFWARRSRRPRSTNPSRPRRATS